MEKKSKSIPHEKPTVWESPTFPGTERKTASSKTFQSPTTCPSPSSTSSGIFCSSAGKKGATSNEYYVNALNIKVSDINNSILSLSGGNQQKAVLAKALGSLPQIIILDNPTQGVDVGAKLEIYSILMELSKQGVSVVVLSSEAQEILRVCDRIYVMCEGEIRRELSRSEATEEKIMVLATGGTLSDETQTA